MFIDFCFFDICGSGDVTMQVHTQRAAQFMKEQFGLEFERHKPVLLPNEEAKRYKDAITKTKNFILMMS